MLLTASTRTNRITTRFLLAAMTLLLTIAVPVIAQEAQAGSMSEMKVPETAQDHTAMAEHYQKIAAQLAEDIEMHKKMLADFNKTVASNPKAGENPYSKQMRLHCQKYIKAAEDLEAQANASATFHTMRAKEMEGK